VQGSSRCDLYVVCDMQCMALDEIDGMESVPNHENLNAILVIVQKTRDLVKLPPAIETNSAPRFNQAIYGLKSVYRLNKLID